MKCKQFRWKRIINSMMLLLIWNIFWTAFQQFFSSNCVVSVNANCERFGELSAVIRTFYRSEILYICKCNLLLLVHHIFIYFFSFYSLNMTYSKAWWNFLENRMRWPENGKNYSLLQYSMKAKAKRAVKQRTHTHTHNKNHTLAQKNKFK